MQGMAGYPGMDGTVAVAAVKVVRSTYHFSLAFWYYPHLASRVLQWERRLPYVSVVWSWCLIQSLAFWYLSECLSGLC